jgi:hypothetical protein
MANKADFIGAIKSIYKRLGNEDDLIELMFDYEIVRNIAKGLSNATIARILDTSVGDVAEVCKKYFNFDGFEKDLDIFDAYVIYLQSNRSFDLFSYKMTLCSATITFDEIEKAFEVCKIFDELERRLNEKWR